MTQKEERILEQLAFISLMMDVVDIEMTHDISTTKFHKALLNNHVRRIKESVKAIRQSLGRYINVINKEEALYNYTLHFHQLLKHFKEKDGATIEKLVTSLESYEKNKICVGTEIIHS